MLRRKSDTRLELTARRSFVGSVLFMAAAITFAAAIFLDRTGISTEVGPLPFLGSLIFLKLGLFSFWPIISRNGQNASAAVADFFPQIRSTARSGGAELRRRIGSSFALDPFEILKRERQESKPNDMVLWNEADPRLDLSLFTANVPTFVLSHEHRFLDWNPAFDLAFRDLDGLRRGNHVRTWFAGLDNFRRVPNRTEQLYGEGILPLADRERATYISKTYGRMVFTKIMNPILSRQNGKVIGWTVVLNINSVNQRQRFLKDLYERIKRETQAIRYASAWDGIFGRYKPYVSFWKIIGDAIVASDDTGHSTPAVLVLGAHTGLGARELLKRGMSVTAVEKDINLLRQIRMNGAGYESKLRIVRQNLLDIRRLPPERYDAVVIGPGLERFDDPHDIRPVLKDAYRALKSGGICLFSALLAPDGTAGLLNDVRRSLESGGRDEAQAYQLRAVVDYEEQLVREKKNREPLERQQVRNLALSAGFVLEREVSNLLDGSGLLLLAKKVINPSS